MKQTAVEWFAEQVEQHVLTFGNIQPNVITKLKNLSKAMEKEQIIHAFGIGMMDEWEEMYPQRTFETTGDIAEDYYNENFNTKEK